MPNHGPYDPSDIADVDTITCPWCGRASVLADQVRDQLIKEIGAWDRRYESPRNLLETLLCILAHQPHQPQPAVGTM